MTAATQDRFVAHFGPDRGWSPTAAKPALRDNDSHLAFSDDGLAAVRDWCMRNITPEKPCGGVVVYRQGGVKVDGAAYSDPGVALGQAGARRTRLHRRGIEASAVLLEVSTPDYGDGEYWRVHLEMRHPGGRSLTGSVWKKAEYSSPLDTPVGA